MAAKTLELTTSLRPLRYRVVYEGSVMKLSLAPSGVEDMLIDIEKKQPNDHTGPRIRLIVDGFDLGEQPYSDVFLFLGSRPCGPCGRQISPRAGSLHGKVGDAQHNRTCRTCHRRMSYCEDRGTTYFCTVCG